MRDLLPILTSLAWPFAIAIAWVAGEVGQRWTGLPRISFYGVIGSTGSAASGASGAGRRGIRSLPAPR